MQTAVIYARYSSYGQTEQSIEGQMRECMEYAAKNDITVLDFSEGYYADTFRSVRFSSPDDLSGFVGSVQWIWQSKFIIEQIMIWFLRICQKKENIVI